MFAVIAQQIIISIVISLIIAALTPVPKPPRRAAGTLEIPDPHTGDPIPVLFGEDWLDSGSVVWHGRQRTVAHRKKSGGGLFGGGKKQTVGHWYYMSVHMVLGHGPMDEISEVQVGRRTAWSGSITTTQSFSISAASLFGGTDREGGVSGRVAILFGESTQPVLSGYQAKVGSENPVPAYRGVTSILFGA